MELVIKAKLKSYLTKILFSFVLWMKLSPTLAPNQSLAASHFGSFSIFCCSVFLPWVWTYQSLLVLLFKLHFWSPSKWNYESESPTKSAVARERHPTGRERFALTGQRRGGSRSPLTADAHHLWWTMLIACSSLLPRPRASDPQTHTHTLGVRGQSRKAIRWYQSGI